MKWIYVVENTLEKQNARLTHVIEFCHAVKKTDNLILVSQSNPSALSQLADFECLQIKPIHIRPHNLGYIFNTIKAFFYLRKLLKITKPDVIYERAGGFSLGPLLIARFKHIPAILEINGNWDEEQKLALKQVSFPAKALVALTNKLRSFSLTLACQIATQLIVVSPNIARFLQKKGVRDKDKILIVTNGVNVERFTPMDMTICKKDLNLDGNVDYIGFIGSLSAWQGVEDLILAYSHLPQELTSKFHLLIVGDGPEYKRCHDLCEQVDLDNSVIFTGALVCGEW